MAKSERCESCQTEHSPNESCDAETLVRARYTEIMGSVIAAAPRSDDEALIGTTIGPFRVMRKLGRGGMGTVFLGEHISIGSKVAIKVLHEHLASDKSLIERFWSEARAVNVIAHDNIVNVFDMQLIPPSRHCLVMEYLDGVPLSALSGAPLPPVRVVSILSQVLDALSAAHAHGIVHRDLKPENVYLLRRGRRDDFVKLLDFGIAKLLNPLAGSAKRSGDSSVHAIIGTPHYMAPEQSDGDPVDGRADLYAVGVMAYYLLSGKLPFTGKGVADLLIAHRTHTPPLLSDVVPGLPKKLAEAVATAMDKRPDGRFETANDMREALEAAMAAPPVVAAPPPAQQHGRHVATYECRVQRPDGSAFDARLGDLSRGGAFVRSPSERPPLMSRVKLRIRCANDHLDLDADVVRHVTAEQAAAWRMEPGFGVQFAQLPATVRAALDRLLLGLPLREAEKGAPAGGDPKAAAVLAAIAQRLAGSHYVFLGVSPECEFAELRRRAREMKEELEALGDSPALAAKQKQQVHCAIERISEALRTLLDPSSRAEYDAARGNYAGVARCLSAGLTATELEALRRRFVANNESQVGRAHVRFIAATAWQQRGDEKKAFAELEQALTLDPLNLDLQKRYWSLKRKLQAA